MWKRQKIPEEERTRKRVRRESSWKENVRKKLKEKDKEYTSKKGVLKKAKELKTPCNCRMKCNTKISQAQRKSLFENFYLLSRDAQDQYIAETIKESEKQRERVQRRKESEEVHKESRRNFTRKYYLSKEDRQSVEVWKKIYHNSFDLTLKKIRVITEKKRRSE
ncbi:uncharacterized protein [Onthophagus taurus]|uniref:uncharacterized protein n=1 Tax=Onthophagus taurus TaxID=166361 RepID=UPI0039BE200B